MNYCDCDGCQELPFDLETEQDEMTLMGTGLLAFITPGDRYEWIAGNALGYQLVMETHSV